MYYAAECGTSGGGNATLMRSDVLSRVVNFELGTPPLCKVQIHWIEISASSDSIARFSYMSYAEAKSINFARCVRRIIRFMENYEW